MTKMLTNHLSVIDKYLTVQIAGKKIDSLDNKIEAIEAEMASIPACTAAINKLIAGVECREPNKVTLDTLSTNLANCTQLLKQPQLLVTRHEHKLSNEDLVHGCRLFYLLPGIQRLVQYGQ